MKEKTMTWQTTQLFLSANGVHEVEINLDTQKLRCTCDGASMRGACKHTAFVNKRMDLNGGIYPVEVSKSADLDMASALSLDPKAFRNFLVKYGKIEAL
jgi:hypothetical protein